MRYISSLFVIILFACSITSCTRKEAKLNVMSFNIRYDNPGDSLNNWSFRKDVAAQAVLDNQVDVMGTQEVLHNQLTDLLDRLPGFKAIGVGREDGKEKGEYSAIFYNSDRFKEIKSGWFWLSETPEVPGSKGWDGACERIATWAVLKDKLTGRSFFFINTHLDHVGVVARYEGIALLIDRIKSLSGSLPVIMTGDFNATNDTDVFAQIVDPIHVVQLFDSKMLADFTTDDKKGTFHGFGKIAEEDRPLIDYIFIDGRSHADSYRRLDDKIEGIYLSDHNPIVATLTIE